MKALRTWKSALVNIGFCMRICLACCWFCSIRFWGTTNEMVSVLFFAKSEKEVLYVPSSETWYRRADSSTFRRGSPLSPRRRHVFRPLFSPQSQKQMSFVISSYEGFNSRIKVKLTLIHLGLMGLPSCVWRILEHKVRDMLGTPALLHPVFFLLMFKMLLACCSFLSFFFCCFFTCLWFCVSCSPFRVGFPLLREVTIQWRWKCYRLVIVAIVGSFSSEVHQICFSGWVVIRKQIWTYRST